MWQVRQCMLTSDTIVSILDKAADLLFTSFSFLKRNVKCKTAFLLCLSFVRRKSLSRYCLLQIFTISGVILSFLWGDVGENLATLRNGTSDPLRFVEQEQGNRSKKAMFLMYGDPDNLLGTGQSPSCIFLPPW